MLIVGMSVLPSRLGEDKSLVKYGSMQPNQSIVFRLGKNHARVAETLKFCAKNCSSTSLSKENCDPTGKQQ
jgi:hypothetical protein